MINACPNLVFDSGIYSWWEVSFYNFCCCFLSMLQTHKGTI